MGLGDVRRVCSARAVCEHAAQLDGRTDAQDRSLVDACSEQDEVGGGEEVDGDGAEEPSPTHIRFW